MHSQEPVALDEIILKRIPPGRDNIKPRDQLQFRATSFAIRPRPNESFSSFSRRCITPAPELLRIESARHDTAAWSVAALTVASVRELGLDVRFEPTDEDPGHCVICSTDERPVPQSVWSKLAKQTTIVYGVGAPLA